MKIKHEVSSQIKPTFRDQKISGIFDVPQSESVVSNWEFDFPIEDKEWNVGLIVGASGAGKTTLSKVLFEDAILHEGFNWPDDKSVISGFADELSVKDISNALNHVGFNSITKWRIPFRSLSNGQKFRAEMARIILESPKDRPVIVDEFTSVVDRQVAKASSLAVQKYVRKQDKKFVAVSCHFDIAHWLQPDWILKITPSRCTFVYTRGLERLRRPEIRLTIQRVHHSAWELFKGHHYMSADIHRAAECYVAFWDGTPIGFGSAIHFPHNVVKNLKRSHRTVVLPDYQGLGVGGAIQEAVGDHYIERGFRFTGTASHPAMIAYREHSPKWVCTRKASRAPIKGKSSKVTGQSSNRLTASHEYRVGEWKKYV